MSPSIKKIIPKSLKDEFEILTKMLNYLIKEVKFKNKKKFTA